MTVDLNNLSDQDVIDILNVLEFVSVEEAAKAMEVSYRHMYTLCERGYVGRRIGRSWVLTLAEIRELLRKGRPPVGRPPRR